MDGAQRSGDLSAPSGAASATATTQAVVAVSGLSKSYGGIRALQEMHLSVVPGTVHAVVGENGAGKSTLMKILAGAVQPDQGEIHLSGELVAFGSPQDARKRGIGIVYQELSLFPERSVLANLFPDQQPTRRGLIDRDAMRRDALPVLKRLGLSVDPETTVGDLGLAERQLVEICRVLVERPRVLILDEPNSALNERETQQLFGILRDLTAEGITIIYVSHRLEEVFAISDRITVMRNGQLVFTRARADLTIAEMVRGMVGDDQERMFPQRPLADAAAIEGRALRVHGLTVGDELSDVSFTARAGEIIGLAGLEGAGVATLLGVLFGTRQASSGEVQYPDGGGLPRSPTAAARRGVALVPADRRHQGLLLDRSVNRNIGLVSVGALPSRSPWLDSRELTEAARRQIDRLRIKVRSPETVVGSLSGGNQQKVVIGKWLTVSPTLMLLDDPTRGVDIGAKHELYLLIRRLAQEGRIVLFRSTELPELVGVADRILIFYRGRLATEIRGVDATDHGVLHAINTGRPPEPEPSTEEVYP